MSTDWTSIILDTPSPAQAWEDIFFTLLEDAKNNSSPVTLHDLTVIPDRLLSEAAWELWENYPDHAKRTSAALKEWCAGPSPSGQAVLILDALSIRELPLILGGAQNRNLEFSQVRLTGSECPSTTNQFAKALGLPSRSALANDGKPGTFSLFDEDVYTDVISLPFEDCAIPPSSNLFIWHSWLDDIIHLQQKQPDQVAKMTATVLQSDGFWSFINKMRQGRKLIITSDHGYAVSKRFSSEVTDPDAIDILRKTFGASRNKPASSQWKEHFMPPIVMTYNDQHVVMGQRKWKAKGGFPHICHGGMSLLEAVVPFLELPAL